MTDTARASGPSGRPCADQAAQSRIDAGEAPLVLAGRPAERVDEMEALESAEGLVGREEREQEVPPGSVWPSPPEQVDLIRLHRNDDVVRRDDLPSQEDRAMSVQRYAMQPRRGNGLRWRGRERRRLEPRRRAANRQALACDEVRGEPLGEGAPADVALADEQNGRGPIGGQRLMVAAPLDGPERIAEAMFQTGESCSGRQAVSAPLSARARLAS